MYAPANVSPENACPECGAPLQRIQRKAIDRLISLAWPVRRYRCSNFLCEWEGNLRRSPKLAGPEASAQTSQPAKRER
jgi:hypothetical protein